MSTEQLQAGERTHEGFQVDPRFLGAAATHGEHAAHVLEHNGHTSADAAREHLMAHNPTAREILSADQKTIEELRAANEALSEELERMGIDPDTGALNRVGLNRRLQNEYGISHSEPTFSVPHERRTHIKAQRMLMLLGDVCDLKQTNDTLGHGAGDAMLRRAAEKAQELLRDGDIIARVGGDEFVMLVALPEHTSETETEAFIEGVVDRLKASFSHQRERPISEMAPGTVVEPIMAIGAAHGLMVDYDTYQKIIQNPGSEHTGTTYHLLLQEADQKMYEHKAELKAKGLVVGRDTPVEAVPAKDLSPADRAALIDKLEKENLMVEIGEVFDIAEHRRKKVADAYAPARQTQGTMLDRTA